MRSGVRAAMRMPLIGLAALAVAGLFASSALAVSNVPVSNGASIDLTAGFTSTQNAPVDVDSVYGVRARGSQDPAPEVMPNNGASSSSLTPDPCSTAGFPGGWCETAHTIAANAFKWDFSATGKGAIIGIVDTGIDLNNPEFKGRVLKGSCIVSAVNACTNSWDKIGGDTGVFPTSGGSTHGTHVTGIAAGANTGIAPGADILPVKVCGSEVDSCIGIDQGILYAATHGASVINVSIGGPIIEASDIASLAQSVKAGALIMVAAGNSGNKDPTGGFLAEAALADGVRGSMIVVGATGAGGAAGLGKQASFSQEPSTRCEVHGGQRYCMDQYYVVAPGLDIWSSVGNGTAGGADYGYLSGTSMATPYVTGVAAVIKGKWPFLTSQQIANVIFSTADDLGAPGIDPVYGNGAVDITKALSPAMVPTTAKSTATATYATAGGMVPTSTAKLGSTAEARGATGALTSVVTGPLASAIARSTLLKNAVVIDAYGRNFNADLTQGAYIRGFGLAEEMLYEQNTTITPFHAGFMSPLGPMFVSGVALDNTTPALGSGFNNGSDFHQYSLQNFSLSASLMQGVSVDMGYNTDMSGRFNDYDAAASPAYDGLFLDASAVNSPYAEIANGGSFVGTSVAASDTLRFRFAAAELTPWHDQFDLSPYAIVNQLEGPQLQYDQRTAQSAMASASWDFAKWGGLGVSATHVSEENGLLGGYDSGALALANTADTTALGVSARVGFGDGWVTTASYSEGITQLDLKPNGIVSSADALHSRSYGVALAKHGVFGNDTLGFAVTRPIDIYAGSVNLTAADGVDANDNLTIGNERLRLSTDSPETDFELGYVTTFMNGALALQTNAAYQMNLDGQGGTNSLAVVSRAKIKF